MHALGVEHEQSRKDRNESAWIYFGNIKIVCWAFVVILVFYCNY